MPSGAQAEPWQVGCYSFQRRAWMIWLLSSETAVMIVAHRFGTDSKYVPTTLPIQHHDASSCGVHGRACYSQSIPPAQHRDTSQSQHKATPSTKKRSHSILPRTAAAVCSAHRPLSFPKNIRLNIPSLPCARSGAAQFINRSTSSGTAPTKLITLSTSAGKRVCAASC